MRKPDFPRVVRCEDDGVDINGHKIAMHRHLEDGLLDDLNRQPKRVREHAGCNPGDGWLPLLHKTQQRLRQPERDVFDDRLYKALWAQAAYDARATNMLIRYNIAHPALTLVYPFPSNVAAYRCQGLHETGGLPGNWALDWCAPPGSPLVAVERAVITRLSGSDPDTDRPDPYGVFGWTTYYRPVKGGEWFWTHQGKRALGIHVGQTVEAGDPVGFVGDQAYRPDHIHGGYSSPLGEAAARRHVEAVNRARKVTL
jgi:hypothetical protein